MGIKGINLKNFNMDFIKRLMSSDLKDIKELFKSDNEKTNIAKKTRRSSRNIPNKLIGFDLGSKNIKVVEGRKNKDRLIIDKMFTIPTPGEIIIDGKLLNFKNLADIIKFSIEQEELNANYAVCTTKSTTILNREIVIPKVEEEEMETVIKHEMQQYLPIALDDYILQYKILGELDDELGGNERYKVNVIALPQEMARDYYDLLLQLELKPFALDVDYNSIEKLMDFNREINNYECKEDDTNLLIDIGASSINVSIYNEGKIDFTRMIKSGGDDIDLALSRKLTISVQAAEEVKMDQGNLHNILADDFINNEILEVVNEWILEIERMLQFYRNKNGRRKIDNIYIYGGGSNINGLTALIREKFGIPTKTISELSNIEFAEKEIDEPIEQYLNAIGSIIRY